MDKLVIQGGRPLRGRVRVSGAKNAALPAIAASLLTGGWHRLGRIPRLRDINTIKSIMAKLGAVFQEQGDLLEINTDNLTGFEAPYELVKTMRASILLLGPLLARYGRAKISLPGGCAIGARPVNLHLKALAAMGKKAEALRYAEESRGLNEPDEVISAACEEILLSSGLRDEAYDRYAIEANQKTTYLATFRAIAKKYPHKEPGDILRDLVASSPGSEGKWFAAAKSAGLFQEAIALAAKSPCDPRTLTRAARDMKEKEPYFAVEAGIAALHWLLAGYGYEIQGVDVMNACRYTMEAAAHGGCLPEVRERILKMISQGNTADGLVSRIIRHELDGSTPPLPLATFLATIIF